MFIFVEVTNTINNRECSREHVFALLFLEVEFCAL